MEMDDSDDSEIDFPKSTAQKSPGKKKRKKSLIPKDGKTYTFDLKISESNAESFSEFNWLDLVSRKETVMRKSGVANGGGAALTGGGDQTEEVKSGLDPYASDDDEDLKAMAAKFEHKYGGPPPKKKKKAKRTQYDDLGEGYDEEDPFIDNSECFDELVPKNVTTAHGGFYINVGALEFKENKDAVYSVSEDSTDDEVGAKKKKLTKKQLKKQGDGKKVKFNEPKKKAKMINTKPRIITTDKNKTGPKFVKNGVKKAKVVITDLKKKSGEKPLSVGKTISKAPEIIDLEAQLNALSGDGDICITNVITKTSSLMQTAKPGASSDSTNRISVGATATTGPKAGTSVSGKTSAATTIKAGVTVTQKCGGTGAPKSLGSTTITPVTNQPSNSIKSKMNLPSNLDVTITTVSKPGVSQSPKLSVGSQPPKVGISNTSITTSSISLPGSKVDNPNPPVNLSKSAQKSSVLVSKAGTVNAKGNPKSKPTDKDKKAFIPQLHDLSTSISLAIASPPISSNPTDLSKSLSLYQHATASVAPQLPAFSKKSKEIKKPEAGLPGTNKSRGNSPSPLTHKIIAQESRPAKNITPLSKGTKANKNLSGSTRGGVVNILNAPITTPKASKSTASTVNRVNPNTQTKVSSVAATPANRSKPTTATTVQASVLTPFRSEALVTPQITAKIPISPSQPFPPPSLTSVSNPPPSAAVQTNSLKNTSSSQHKLSSFAENLNITEENCRQQLSGSDLSQFLGRQAAQAAITLNTNTAKQRQTTAQSNTESAHQHPTQANQLPIASQITAVQIKPSSTSKPIKPEQSKKVTSSSEGANSAGLSLTPDITNSLLGFAQSMVTNLEQQELSSPLPANSANSAQWSASGSSVDANNPKSGGLAASKVVDLMGMPSLPTENTSQLHTQLSHQHQAMSKKNNGYDITSLLNQQGAPHVSMPKSKNKSSGSSRVPSTALTHPLPGPPSLPSSSPDLTPQVSHTPPQPLADYQQQYAELYGLSINQHNYINYQ